MLFEALCVCLDGWTGHFQFEFVGVFFYVCWCLFWFDLEGETVESVPAV